MQVTPKFSHLRNISRSVLALVLISAAAGLGASSANATTAPRTPQSIECSKQADAKGLHGKPREAFRAECKHQAKATQAVPAPQPAPAKTTY